MIVIIRDFKNQLNYRQKNTQTINLINIIVDNVFNFENKIILSKKKNFCVVFNVFFLSIQYDDNFLSIQIIFIIDDEFVAKNFLDFNQNDDE